jgi:tetratricopeptide (TPR) repeat protein
MNLLEGNADYKVLTAEVEFENPVQEWGQQEQPVYEEQKPAGPSVSERLERMASSPFKKIVRYLIYAAALLMPLWFLPFSADGLEFEKQTLLIAITGAGLILFLLDVIKSGLLKYKHSSFHWAFAGIILAGIISVIFSVNRFASIFGAAGRRDLSLISWVCFAILVFLAINVVEDRGKTLKNILTSSVVLALLFAALQTLGLFLLKGVFAKNTFNTIGILNSVGILAAICLPLFLSYEISGDHSKFDKFVKYFRYLGVVLSLFFLVLVNWYVVWIVAFVGLAALIALSSGSSRLEDKVKNLAVPMTIIVLGIFLMLVNFNLASLKGKFPVEISPTFGTSLGIAKDSLMSRPLGYGLENFGIVYDKFKPTDIANTVFYQVGFDSGNATVINLAVEGGILMLLAFLSLVWFYGREFVSRIRGISASDKMLNSVWAASLGLLVAFFLYPLNMTLLFIFFSLLILLSLSFSAKASTSESSGFSDGSVPGYDPENAQHKVIDLEGDAKYSFLSSLSFVVGLVLVLIGWYFTVNNYLSNVYLARALAGTNQTESINLLVKSANVNGQDTRPFRYLSQLLIIQLGNDLKSGPKKDETKENYNTRVQNELASAVNVARQATTINSFDAQNWANLAYIYQNLVGLVNGADQAAVGTYQEALKRYPANPDSYLQIGATYLTAAENLRSLINNPPADQAGKLNVDAIKAEIAKDLTLAEDNFKKSIGLYNNYGPALYDLSVVYDRQGKIPEAIKQFEKLQAANPNDPSIVFQLGLLYYRNNQKDNAFQAWQRAVVLFPNYSNARWYLSLIYEERGDLENALAQVEAIQKLNPDDQTVQQRLTQLQSGKRIIPPGKVLDQKPLRK